MSFLYPEYLIFIIPLFIFLYKALHARRVFVHTLILMLLLSSLSRPSLEEQIQSSDVKGRDVVIALDISYSMRAKDIEPSRYEYAKELIKEFLAKNPDDNIMLMVFTTNPMLISPPTTDHQLILTALNSLNLEYILTKGTSLKRLFEKFNTIGVGKKNIILISDGGDEDNLEDLVELMQNKPKSLSIIALGDSSGSTIEKEDGSLLKDSDGNLVISRINPLLKELSSRVDANYFVASSEAKDSADILSDMMGGSDEIFEKKEHSFVELYQIPLLLATLLFLVLHTKAVKYLVILLTFFSLHLEASMLDMYRVSCAKSSYNSANYTQSLEDLKEVKTKTLSGEILRANSLYRLGEYESAVKIYLSIKSSNKDVKKGLYYNIANSYAMLGSYSSARVFYAKVLQLGSDRDAEFNLSIVAFRDDERPLKSFKTLPKPQKDSSSDEDFQSSDKKQKSKQQSRKVKDSSQKYPISSKTYELINKGYIDEKKPW